MKKKGLFVINRSTPAAVSENEKKMNLEVDLEEALDLAGAGKYQLFHCTLMLASLTSAIIEIIGPAFILPAAVCDLEIPESLKGIITSVPNIGVILTAPFWGRAADSMGRKPVLLISLAASGVIGIIAAFMPDLTSFALVKLVGALFVSCPSSLGFAYAGELVPRKRRDIAVLACNGLLMLATTLSPLFAWAVLTDEWHSQLGTLNFRPWRLLTIVYAAPLILAAIWMTQAKESPKFLMTKGKQQEALEVLRHIYAKNTGESPYSYCVVALKESPEEGGQQESVSDGSESELAPKEKEVKNESALALLMPPHLKWLALTGFLMFGVFSSLNGLFLFAANTINKVMSGSSEEVGTVCIVMNQAPDNSTAGVCIDTISQDTFTVMVITTFIFGMIVLVASLLPLSKKTLLVGMYSVNGIACLLSGLCTNRMVGGAAMSALQLTSLGIGPLTAYAVDLFPTSVRGLAVGAVLMFGRVGSVAGANAAGYFLTIACDATFYGFAALLFLCGVLSFLLPGERKAAPSQGEESPGTETNRPD